MPNPPNTPPPCPREDCNNCLDQIVQELLIQGHPSSYTIIPFIWRTLKQFGLSHQLEVHDVLLEAYLNGKLFLANGNTIRYPYAWLKRTCYHIILKYWQRLSTQKLSEPESLEFLVIKFQTQWVSDEELADRLVAFWNVFETIRERDPEAAELIELKVVEGLSWKEIRERLIARGKPNVPSEAALRQQATRIKKLLRQLFHEVEAQL